MGIPRKQFIPEQYYNIGVGFNFDYTDIKTKFINNEHDYNIVIGKFGDISIVHIFKTDNNFEYKLTFKLVNNRLESFESILEFDFEKAKIELEYLPKSNIDRGIDNIKSANELTGIIFKIIREFSDKYPKISSFSTFDYIHQTKQDMFKYIFEHKLKDKYIKTFVKHNYFNPYNEIIYSKF